MSIVISRRHLIAAAAVTAISGRSVLAHANPTAPAWRLPIRNPGGLPGDGFLIRHGFACENTWFFPNWWHAAEDWYRAGDVETAGAEVLAVTGGEVVWIGSDYPGRVVLILHPDGLYGMYGHLDYAVDVLVGQQVVAGQVLGRVLAWTDGRAPSHLHFEIRNFFLNPVVNGEAPKYALNCGYRCPPGPGYWAIGDPMHPAEMGWRNPQHVIHAGLAATGMPTAVVVASTAEGFRGPLRTAASHDAAGLGDVTLRTGERFPVVGMEVGDPASLETSAYGYRIWYQVQLPSGSSGWLPAFLADDRDVGSDGRPSSLRPVLLPAVM